MIDEQWKEFEAKQDWSYRNRHNWPTYEECYKEGIKAGIKIATELREIMEKEQGNYCEGTE